jgi:protein-tyrosine-phosphatase
MTCLIKDNVFFAPNGNESQLYKDLSEIVGKSKAKELFVFAYSDKFPQKFSPIEKEGEYKSGTTTISFGDYTNPINNRKSGEIELKLIQTPQKDRGKGRARTTINEFLAYTDALGKDVVLTVSPRDKSTTEKQLIEFYKSVGFVQSLTGFEMIRYRKPSVFDQNGEPKIKKVIELARQQNENTEPLTTVEKVELGLLMAQFPNIETSDDLLVEMEKAFYSDGLFNPSQQSLTNTLYSRYEAENLLSDVRLLAQVKDSVERLKNTDTIDNSTVLEAEYRTEELNIFGKFKLLNPYIVQQDTIEEFGGQQNINTSEIRDKSITEEYLQQFKKIPVIDENGNPILNKTVYENAAKLVEEFDNLTEEKLLDYGIDLSQASGELKNLILQFPSIDNILLLNENAAQRVKTVKIEKQERDLVYLETVKTEEQLFNELNLIQTETPNIYHRIERVDEQELRSFLQVEDNVAEYELYKNYYGYTTSITKEEGFTLSPIETDIEYLKGDFVADFNAEILKNPTHEFYNKFEVNEKGISLKYDDPISISQIEAYISDGVKLGKELVDYSVISKLMPNFKQETAFEDLRLNAVNNKNSLKIPTTQIAKVDENTIIAKNETADFINYKNEVYELTNKEKNDSVYKKLSLKEDLNYYQTEIQSQDYVDQVKVTQPNLENYNYIKKLYKSAELEDNFDCVA